MAFSVSVSRLNRAIWQILTSAVLTLIPLTLVALGTQSDNVNLSAPSQNTIQNSNLKTACVSIVSATVRKQSVDRLAKSCLQMQQLPACHSTEGQPIFHTDALSPSAQPGAAQDRTRAGDHGKRILVLGMIHGDEPLAGEMALEWLDRLQSIEHRNNWRIVPLLNPDGMNRRTRMNANGVDLNRNFPTKDWAHEAIEYWKTASHSDPRRFPGHAAASEEETKCVMAQIKDFKPDFIVSIHTPYQVLDFDGPKVSFPSYKELPWKQLGNYPGSLGRFMWKDHQIPVLTIELGTSLVDAARLQDTIGSLALKSLEHSKAKNPDLFELL